MSTMPQGQTSQDDVGQGGSQEHSWNGKKAYCYRCGHLWIVRGDKRPRLCPRCRTSRYDVPQKKDHKCQFCGNIWRLERIDDKCPQCGRGIYDTSDPLKHHCNQCDYVWTARTTESPARCPLCNSSKWNNPKIPQYVCRRCGHVWSYDKGLPGRCPKCQSLKWNENAFKLQCRRCGYKWISNNTESSDNVRMCPSCKSKKWNEPPNMVSCSKCGSIFIPQTTAKVCPKCSRKSLKFEDIDRECGFCGTKWMASGSGPDICPRCGLKIPEADDGSESQIVLWKKDGFKLTYLFKDGVGCMYLWNNGIPETATYIEPFLNENGLKLKSLVQMAANPEFDGFWNTVAESMHSCKDDYVSNIPYFMKRLGLDKHCAEVLALHFIGMCPEAIAMRLDQPIDHIRHVFDIIMDSYTDNGIVVNDHIFTDDPIALYDKGSDAVD